MAADGDSKTEGKVETSGRGAAASRRYALEGVDRDQVVESVFEGVRVFLSYRGEAYSPAQ